MHDLEQQPFADAEFADNPEQRCPARWSPLLGLHALSHMPRDTELRDFTYVVLRRESAKRHARTAAQITSAFINAPVRSEAASVANLFFGKYGASAEIKFRYIGAL